MEDTAHYQAVFFSKDSRHSIPKAPFSIPVTVTRVELNDLIDEITDASASEIKSSYIQCEFDFLIFSELLRGSLEEHVTRHRLSTETVLQVECVERDPPPRLCLDLDHKDWVSAVHCYQNLILTGCYDNNVRVWTKKGGLVCVAEGHTSLVKDVHWISGDGSEFLFLSASQDQHVHIWRLSLETKYQLHTNGNDDEANDVTPVGHVTLLHRCKGHAKSVEALAVSPDGSKFCSVSWDGFVKVWSSGPDSDPSEAEEEGAGLPPKKLRTDFGWGAPPPTIATTRTPLVTYQGHKSAVTTVVWAGADEEGAGPDGEIITGGWDNCIRMWDLNTGSNKSTLNCSKAFHSISLSAQNNLIASGNSDRVIRLWDARKNDACLVQSSLTSHSGWVVSVKWSPRNCHHLLSGSYDSTLRLWDTRSNKKPLYSIPAHQGKILCTDWSDTKMFASGGTDNKLRTFSI